MKYIYETHLHTKEASACGRIPGAQMARKYKAAGYTGVVITDHFIGGNTAIDQSLPWEQWVENFCKGYENAKAEGDRIGLQVFFGWESGFHGTEFLIFGLDKKWLLDHPEIRDCSIEEQYALVHAGGGIVIHAHPFRERGYIPEVRLYPDHVDAVEAYNAAHSSARGHGEDLPQWNDAAAEFANTHNLPMTAGSDQHGNTLRCGGMVFDRKIADVQDFCQAILRREAVEYLDGADIQWRKRFMERQYVNPAFPNFLHGADYNPEQWMDQKEQIWNEDMRLMKLANCNEMTVGIFSWAILEPREGEYDFSFLDEILDKIYANGSRVILATPSGARPRWMAEKYPEVLRVTKDLRRMHYSERHNHCFTSPVYREKVTKINTLLAQRYGKHPAVLAWHLSNEYSGECHCDLCQNAFRDYLRKRYDNDIEKLNKAYWSTFWSHRFDSFDQVEAPGSLTDRVMHGLNLDWRRFVSTQTMDFIQMETAALRQGGSQLPVTTNMMWATYDLDHHQLAQAVDVISWDCYPDWHRGRQAHTAADAAFQHDLFRCLKQKPFLLMESAPGLVNWHPVNKLKRPGMDKLQSMQAVAHGSDSVQYFQYRKSRGSVEKFHGAIVDHVGTEDTRVFKTVQDTGALLKTINEVAGSMSHSRVAIVYDWENRWALDDAQFIIRADKKYDATCLEYYKYFWNRSISVDVVGKHCDFHAYDLVILPMLYMTDETTIHKIQRYVKDGGTVYATYTLGMVNETDLCHLGGFPGGELKAVFGIWNEEVDSLYDHERVQVSGFEENYEGRDICELIHANTAQVLATYGSEFYAGMPALTVNAYGGGKAYYQAFRDTGAFKAAALDRITADLGISGELPFCPAGVTAHARYADGVQYLFVENYEDKSVSALPLKGEYTDMETGKILGCVDLEPFGVRVLKRNI